jgi:glycosyltransferase involved in cell wall biosynthesis
MREKAIAAGLGPPEKFSIAYSGMEVERFLEPQNRSAIRSRLGIPQEAIVAGIVSRLAPLKGQDFLIDAAKGIHLLLVGDGERRSYLELRARNRGLPVTFTGMVSPDQIPELLGAMDFLVHTSFREGLPRAIPQAIIAGIPVVAFDCDGAREVVVEGKTGRLVPPGDLPRLRIALQTVRSLQIPMEIRREYAERFCWQRMVDTLEESYQALLRGIGDRG